MIVECFSADFVGLEVDIHSMSANELTTLQKNFNALQVCCSCPCPIPKLEVIRALGLFGSGTETSSPGTRHEGSSGPETYVRNGPVVRVGPSIQQRFMALMGEKADVADGAH